MGFNWEERAGFLNSSSYDGRTTQFRMVEMLDSPGTPFWLGHLLVAIKQDGSDAAPASKILVFW